MSSDTGRPDSNGTPMTSPISILQDAIDKNRRVHFIYADDQRIRWTHITDYRIEDNALVVSVGGVDLNPLEVVIHNYKGHEEVLSPDPNSTDPHKQIALETKNGSLIIIFDHV